MSTDNKRDRQSWCLHCLSQLLSFFTAGNGHAVHVGTSKPSTAASVEGCQFGYNLGGAFKGHTDSVSINNSVFHGNDATTSGGGVYIGESSSSVLVTNSVFNSNTGQLAIAKLAALLSTGLTCISAIQLQSFRVCSPVHLVG